MVNWEVGDDPEKEHSRHFRDRCVFIKGYRTGNVPLDSERTPNAVERARQLGIIIDRPRNPALAMLSARLATYGQWPRDKAQTPEALSAAGFYATGK